ncbi:MAG: PH domain-containing protein [Deltaproteobacteria bacterium]|nr:PH domain-containing protein [Deltaproteobacteria bacterium]
MAQTPIGEFAEFRPAWQSFGVWYFGIFIFLAGPQINPETWVSEALGQLIATLIAAYVVITRFTRMYRVSPDTLEVERTFPSHVKRQVKISDITLVDLRRGISQRFLGVAHVHVYAKGPEGEVQLRLNGVPNPVRFKQVLVDRGASDQQVYGAFRS